MFFWSMAPIALFLWPRKSLRTNRSAGTERVGHLRPPDA
jgi:hypothetical protein